MKPKTLAFLILAAAAVMLFPGCAGTPETKAKWSATGKLVASDVAKIAFQSVLQIARDRLDGSAKADWLDSAAQGLRENALNIVTADDVAKYVAIWTPDKPHWEVLASQLADEYAKAQTPGTRQKIVETIAQGLNLAAASERAP